MDQIFLAARTVEFSYADKTPARKFEESHFQILSELAQKKLFPEIYLELLNSLSLEDKNELSKKFLRIYLYASTKIKEPNKLYRWLLKGSLPQSEAGESESMSQLSQNIKRINQLKKSSDRENNMMIKANEKNLKKSTEKLKANIKKREEKLIQLNALYKDQKEIIEDIISEIETSLGSGRKL